MSHWVYCCEQPTRQHAADLGTSRKLQRYIARGYEAECQEHFTVPRCDLQNTGQTCWSQ